MNEWNTGDSPDVVKLSDLDEKGVGGLFYIQQEIMSVIQKLCEDIEVEWQMLLIGEECQEGISITDYYIPKQEVTAGNVTNIDCIDDELIKDKGIIATIHSHANMGVFFSSVDEECTNLSLIRYHIVVNNKHEFTACTRWDLPNGKVAFFEAKVVVSVPQVDVVKNIKNIEKVTGKNVVLIDGFKPKNKKYKHALTRENYKFEDLREGVHWYE